MVNPKTVAKIIGGAALVLAVIQIYLMSKGNFGFLLFILLIVIVGFLVYRMLGKKK